jgi:hypothetical protein
MSEKRVVVPEGMLMWVIRARYGTANDEQAEAIRGDLEAALRWQRDNAPVPSNEDLMQMLLIPNQAMHGDCIRFGAVEWVRRMYDAPPEPEVDHRFDALLDSAEQSAPEGADRIDIFTPEGNLLASRKIRQKEPEVLDEIKDLLDAPVQNTFLDTVTTNAKIIEAFRRGQESK